MMDLEYIQNRVNVIKEIQGDFEAAHSEEDKLRLEFIKWVATHEKVDAGIKEKARLILTTDDLDFPRYCA